MASMVECQLCPKYCRIEPGHSGDCRVRINVDGKLISTVYGFPVSVHMDPIEKKPLFHFLPGSKIFSLATAGCNLHCLNCQNHSISQANPEDIPAYDLPPERLVSVAIREEAKSIAYTYTDPSIYYEYAYDSCVAARESGLRNVLVSAGYINQKPLRKLLKHVDAANIDLKAFTEDFYKDNCGGHLKPVLRALETYVEMGVWLEVTNLVIPTLNDSDDEIQAMCKWMVKSLGDSVPIHFSRFHPRHKLKNLPATPGSTLERARAIALAAGLKYVYVGNLRSRTGENTYCPNHKCTDRGEPLIHRVGYRIVDNRLVNERCPNCATKVEGVWQ